MRKKRIAILLVTLLFSFSAAGCGEQLIELTPEEEDIIVSYAAGAVAKFNIYQTDGIMHVREEDTAKAEEKKPENTDDPNSSNGGGTNEPEVTKCSLQEALGLSGVELEFNKLTVADYYDDTVSSVPASSGSRFVILHFNMKVTDTQDIDLISQDPVFKLTMNGTEYTQKKTVMTSDLATFLDSVKAGQNRKVVVIFELPKDKTTDTDSYSLSVTMKKGGVEKTSTIKL